MGERADRGLCRSEKAYVSDLVYEGVGHRGLGFVTYREHWRLSRFVTTLMEGSGKVMIILEHIRRRFKFV